MTVLVLRPLRSRSCPCSEIVCSLMSNAVSDIRGVREGRSPPNNFRLSKCDARFVSSGSQAAIKNNVEVSILA